MLITRQGFLHTISPGGGGGGGGADYGSRIMYDADTNQSYTWTNATAQGYIDASNKQFGTGSYYGSVSGTTASYIRTTTSGSAMNVGSGDFCVEGWVYIPTTLTFPNGTRDAICNNVTSDGGGLSIRFGGAYSVNNFNRIQIFARGNADLDRSNAFTWPRDQWVHWAAQRDTANSTISFWMDGTLLTRENGTGGTCISRTFASRTTNQISIGSYDSNGSTANTAECLREWSLDEVCVSDCVRYTYNTDLTPPSDPLYVDEHTMLLMHLDGTQGQTTYENATS